MTHLMRQYFFNHMGMTKFETGVPTGVNRCQWCWKGRKKASNCIGTG